MQHYTETLGKEKHARIYCEYRYRFYRDSELMGQILPLAIHL